MQAKTTVSILVGVLAAVAATACSAEPVEPQASSSQAFTSTETCAAMGGDMCLPGREHAISGYDFVGSTAECTCYRSHERRSCGEMGGDYCLQSGRAPLGYNDLGPSRDCRSCLAHFGPSCGDLGGALCCQADANCTRFAYSNGMVNLANDVTYDCQGGCYAHP